MAERNPITQEKIPLFYGDPKKDQFAPEIYWERVEALRAANQWNDQTAIPLLYYALRGDAMLWFKAETTVLGRPRVPAITWRELRHRFMLTYAPKVANSRPEVTFTALSQKSDESVRQYSIRLQYLVGEIYKLLNHTIHEALLGTAVMFPPAPAPAEVVRPPLAPNADAAAREAADIAHAANVAAAQAAAQAADPFHVIRHQYHMIPQLEVRQQIAQATYDNGSMACALHFQRMMFVTGIRQAVKSELERDDLSQMDWNALIDKAVFYEELIARESRRNVHQIESAQDPSDSDSGNVDAVHRKFSKKSSAKDKSTKNDGACRFCKQTGHQQMTCYKRIAAGKPCVTEQGKPYKENSTMWKQAKEAEKAYAQRRQTNAVQVQNQKEGEQRESPGNQQGVTSIQASAPSPYFW
jgi:hypothetical protein